MKDIRIGSLRIPVPGSPSGRLILGWTLILFGILGFLPILGFWMIPLGLMVLAVDSRLARSVRRKGEVWIGRIKRRFRQRGSEKNS